MKHTIQTAPQQPLAYRVLAHLLSVLLVLQPTVLSAQTVINNSNGGNASDGQSANGVPVVNIATPSAAGVSHNTYDSFNVNQQGLILNNSASVVQSQLGGAVNANSNLQAGQEARIILNEVTQANRSQLNGYTEIAGRNAELIIANPYGITCSGCGFINTPDVTLTTGTPELQNGNLQNYSVNQGDIVIEGLGLNATNVDHFSIIARATQINAEVNANNLDIILGRNDVNPQTLTPTAKVDDGSVKPQFALDSSALGGMYANRITLIGTESGVGVNVAGDMATDTGNLTINIDGSISLANTQSANDLNITSTNGDVELNATTYAVNDLNINANTVNNNDLAAAQNNINITAENLNQNGTLVAGLNNNFTLNNTGDLTLNITDTINNTGETLAGDQLTINAANLNNTNSISAGDTLNLQITNTLNNDNGVLDAGNRFIIDANSITNDAGSITSAGTDTNRITATTLDNDNGTINSNADSFTLDVTTLNNNNNGRIAHAGAQTSVFTLTATIINNNAGFVGSNGRINATGFTQLNNLLGGIIFADHLELRGTNINNNGGQLTASGTSSADITATTISNDGGDIFSVGSLTLNADSLSNSGGKVQSASDITLDLSSWDLNDIDSVINATDFLTINLEGDLVHNAGNQLIANEDLTINVTNGNIINSGEISTGRDFIFTANNTDSSIESSLTNNSGAILSAGNNLTLTIEGLVNNSGRISAQNTLAITAGTLTNRALIGSATTLNITTLLGDLRNQNGGTLFSNNTMSLRTDQSVRNLIGSNIFAVNDLTIEGNTNALASELLNESANIESFNGNINISATTTNNRRTVFQIDNLTRGLSSNSTAAATLYAGGNISIQGNTLRNEASAIAANGDIGLDVQNNITNEGAAFGGGLSNAIRDTGAVSSLANYRNFDITDGSSFVSTFQAWLANGSLTTDEILLRALFLEQGNDSCFSDGETCAIRNIRLIRITANQVQRSLGSINATVSDAVGLPAGFSTYQLTPTEVNTLRANMASTNASGLGVALPFNYSRNYTILGPDNIFPASSIGSTLYAGGSLSNSGTASINNLNGGASGRQSNAANVSPRNADTTANSTPLVNVTTGTALDPYIYDPAANLTLPTGGGLFTVNTDPSQNFLIETNPALLDLGFFDPANPNPVFVGTDDIFNLLPEDPEVTTRRLGDAFYETRLVREAVFQTTGRRYLNDNINNDAEQMQYLMNNAIAVREDLQLSVGISLSADQVAQLTHDIIWLEEKQVQGHTVLVPVYYASSLRHGDMVANGALLMADNISLNFADGVVNMGTISAQQSANINAAKDILNSGGRINADQNLQLQAGGSLSNIRGRISTSDNGNLLLIARAGSINNSQGDIDAGIVELQAQNGGLDNQQGRISAAGQLDIAVKDDIVLDDTSQLRAGGNANLTSSAGSLRVAGNNNKTNTNNNKAGQAEQIDIQGDLTTTVANDITFDNTTLNVGGNTSLTAGQDITLSASDINSGGNIGLTGDNISLNAEAVRTQTSTHGRTHTIERSVRHNTSDLQAGGDMAINATGDVTTQGSELQSGNNTIINAAGDINLQAVYNEDSSYSQTKERGRYGRRKTTTTEDLKITSQGTKINTGGNLLMNIGVDSGGTIDKLASGNISFEGSDINVDGQAVIYADGNVNVFNAVNLHQHRHEVKKTGALGLSKSNEGHTLAEQSLQATDLMTQGDISLLSDDNINIVASNLDSGGNVNLQAFNDVVISAGLETLQTSQWQESSRMFSGGSLMSKDKVRDTDSQNNYIATSIFAQGNLNIDAGSASIIGSQAIAGEQINITTDIGDVEIIAAGSSQHTTHFEEHQNLSYGDAIESLMDFEGTTEGLIDGVKDSGQLKINLGTATYDKINSQTDSITHSASRLQAANGINISSAGDINIVGSELFGDANQDQSGDITLQAEGDVSILEAEDSIKNQSEATHGTAELNIVVQNEYEQIARVAEALDDAKDALKQAKRDYKAYKRDLDKQQANLAELEIQYANKEPGISFADIADLREIVQDMQDDKEWYQAGIAAAALGATSATTRLAQQIATAVASSGTWGFNAGIQLDIDATKTQTESSQTTSLASIVDAHNINIMTGGTSNVENSNTLIQGSHLNAYNNLNITTGTLDIKASKDTYESETNTEHGHITIAQTVYGAASGPTVSGSYDRSRERSRSTTYNNSTLNAADITLSTTGDANIQGATVRATDDLTANIGGDLLVESMQNRSSSKGNSIGVSGGLGLGGKNNANKGQTVGSAVKNFGTNGNITSANGGISASNSSSRTRETVLTSLTSGGTATINVGGHTQVNGAVIATTDDDNNDLGQLNLSTETFAFENLRNSHISKDQSIGLNAGIGIAGSKPDDPASLSSANIQYNNTSSTEISNTLATIGDGTFTIRDEANSHDTTTLNRDTQNTEKEIVRVERTKGNIDVDVDTRLFMAEGLKEIGQDFEKVGDIADRVIKTTQSLGVNLDQDMQGLLGTSGEKAINSLMRNGYSEAEANQFIKDHPEVISTIAGLETVRGAFNDPLAFDQQQLNTTLQNQIDANVAQQLTNDLNGETTVIGVKEPETKVEQAAMFLGEGQRYMDQLYEANPTAARMAEIAIVGATGGPVKAALSVPVNMAIETAAGEQIGEAMQFASEYGGTVLTQAEESRAEFAEDVAYNGEEGNQAKIQDGARFVMTSLLGLNLPGGKGNKPNTQRSVDDKSNPGTRAGGTDAEAGTPYGGHHPETSSINYDKISTAKPHQATKSRDLNEQVHWNDVQKNPNSGRPIANANNDSRFPSSEGWQKMEATKELPDGTNISIHYQYNKLTGKAYDMKFDTPQRVPSVLQPGTSIRD